MDSCKDGLCGPFQLTTGSATKASLHQIPVLPFSHGSRIGDLVWHPNGFLLPLIDPRPVKNVYLFWAVLGLCCCAGAFSSCGEQRLLCSCGALDSHCSGFSCFSLWVLKHKFSSWHSDLVALKHVESFQVRDQTCVPCIGRCLLNHWTAGEVPARAPLTLFCLCCGRGKKRWWER